MRPLLRPDIPEAMPEMKAMVMRGRLTLRVTPNFENGPGFVVMAELWWCRRRPWGMRSGAKTDHWTGLLGAPNRGSGFVANRVEVRRREAFPASGRW